MLAIFAFILMGIAMLVTVVVLMLGLLSLVKGGSFSQQWSNKLMRYRIIAQFCAIMLFAVGYYLTQWGV